MCSTDEKCLVPIVEISTKGGFFWSSSRISLTFFIDLSFHLTDKWHSKCKLTQDVRLKQINGPTKTRYQNVWDAKVDQQLVGDGCHGWKSIKMASLLAVQTLFSTPKKIFVDPSSMAYGKSRNAKKTWSRTFYSWVMVSQSASWPEFFRVKLPEKFGIFI